MTQERATEGVGDRRKDPAYRNGWEDGRFGPTLLFPSNPNLAGLEDQRERLSYYRGHREGRRAREEQAPGRHVR